ncbi:methenyltetrahydromethanopterin cyclohydrolase [Stieleria varia]|uniref:Methenyltetrahydromethanopterin cyclohydrolase n=1 Tax=Stieleria varia TaxID=2528005 RepID=A0A5C6AGM9_9BACT|nr:methenyltetrahydromethanopterin cyclohydrolase [Stieleria varia]TWT98458.1 Methenyltetrahydromethanopterin cyclohydrolase [Stieleria varia]
MNANPNESQMLSINSRAARWIPRSPSDNAIRGTCVASVEGATLLDAGINRPGSLAAGLLLAKICMGGEADVSITPCDPGTFAVENGVFVHTDNPLISCLGCQYAGWPIQTDDFFAMGSGPMRLLRGKEPVLTELGLTEPSEHAVGVLESDKYPSASAIALIAKDCGVSPDKISLAIAPSTSIAGSVQVVARSIETAMHKLHELEFDVTSIISATGFAPLPPPAKPGDMVAGIGRTNDAMLYGARVTLWVECDDEEVAELIAEVPSCSSSDYGRPFAQIFKDYEYDFYKVDPLLFSPAMVTIHNLCSGRTFSAGKLDVDVLRTSFGLRASLGS